MSTFLQDVAYTVKDNRPGENKGKDLYLLKDVTGYFLPGKCSALVGATHRVFSPAFRGPPPSPTCNLSRLWPGVLTETLSLHWGGLSGAQRVKRVSCVPYTRRWVRPAPARQPCWMS